MPARLLRPLAVRIGAIPWMPKLLPQIVSVDTALQRVSGGRLSLLTIAGLPNVTLTVRGRRSGVLRSTPLLAAPDGDGWLIAGSYFGGPKIPEWVANLRAAGQAQITVSGRRIPVSATEIGPADRPAKWATLVATWPNFTLYEHRTDRTIPIFRLTPLPGP